MRLSIWGIQHTFVGVMLAVSMVACGFAIDLEKETALRLAPEDSDLFFGSMQIQEQWKRFTASKLYRDVLDVPIVQEMTKSFTRNWDERQGKIGELRSNIENPNVESLLKLAQEMISEEIFLMADSQASEFVLGMNSLSNEIMEIVSNSDPQEIPVSLLDFLMQLQKSEIDEIPVPTFVVGFKVKDQERVLGKIDELSAILRVGLSLTPIAESFLNGLERLEDGRGTRLSWTIIPEMVPWAQLRGMIGVNEFAQALGKLEELFEDRELCLTIGQLDGYLVIALSGNQDAITELGSGDSLLKNVDLSPLLQKKNEPITSVAYVSDPYADAYYQSQFKGFFSRQFSLIYKNEICDLLGISPAEGLPDGFDSVPEALASIDEQIEELVPDFQGQAAFSYLTKTGSETWNYARTENVLTDSSKPLSVLEHVSQEPIAMIAFRLQDHPEYFATARRIVRQIKEYLDLIPEIDGLSESERDTWKVALDRGWPLVVELANIWESQFLPSMKEGQHAWVLHEGKNASKQWWKEMPESSKPLPIPDIAIVTGLTSKDEMSHAWSSLFGLFDTALELVRELKPNTIPTEYSVPRPTEVESSVGERYTYSIPPECPAPKTMTPQVLLTERFMFSSYSNQQTNTLAKSQALTVGKEVIAPSKPYSMAAYIDIGKLTQLAKPWIEYAIEINSQDGIVIPESDGMPQVKGTDILELWSALRSAGQMASVTTASEQGGSVTRSVLTQP